MPIKFQEKDSDRCEGASRFELCQYKYLHKEACTAQKKAAVIKYLHIDKYLDINKLSNFIPCILKSSPRKERGERDKALDQGMTAGLGNQKEADQGLHSKRISIIVIPSGITFANHRKDYYQPRHLSNITSPKAFSTPLPRGDWGGGRELDFQLN